MLKFWWVAVVALLVGGCGVFKPADPLANMTQCVLFQPPVMPVTWQAFSAVGQQGSKAFEMLVYPELNVAAQTLTAVGVSPVGAKAFIATVTPSQQNADVEFLFRGQARVGLPLVSDYLLAWADFVKLNRCMPKDFSVKVSATGRVFYRHDKVWLTLIFSQNGEQAEFKSERDKGSVWVLRKL